MAANAVRSSWRRLLSQAAVGVQAELRGTAAAAQPAALPTLLACLRQNGASAGAPAAAAAGLPHCQSFASQAAADTADAAAYAEPAPAAAKPTKQFPRDAGQPPTAGSSSRGSRASGRLRDRQVPLRTWAGDVAGSAVLPGAVFDVEVRRDILQRVVRWQLAKRQQGTHKAKTRREVRGGGRKPHNQKGSGRARAGTIRAPQWRGGGKAHGPVPRSHEHDLQRKVRQMGLRCALSAKAAEGRLIVMDTLAVTEPKTRVMDAALSALLVDAPRCSVLMIDTAKDGADGGADLRLAAGNLPWVDVLPVAGANVYSILQRDYLILSQEAVAHLADRGSRPIRRRRAALSEAAAAVGGAEAVA